MKKPSNNRRHKYVRTHSATRECELEIESLTNSGDGLGRIEQRVVFVPYTMPGDQVKIRIKQEKKSFVIGELKELLRPSPNRIKAQCEFFTQCGGCDWQHVPYQQQLNAKTEQLSEVLKRIGGFTDLPVRPIIACDTPYNYRNRIQGEIRQGKFHYNRRRSEELIAISRCAIAEPAINEKLAGDLSLGPQGRVEISVVDGGTEVSPLAEQTSSQFGFRQVNTSISQVLTDLIMQVLADSDCNQINDLYCGRGEWTTKMAQLYTDKTITGVDASKQNISAAKATASRHGLKNIVLQQGKVETLLKKIAIEDSVCIVDPPRAGLDIAVTQELCKKPARHLLYVSCHPATLARDLKILTESSYTVQFLQPIDMFPQTAHLECFVHLQVSA